MNDVDGDTTYGVGARIHPNFRGLLEEIIEQRIVKQIDKAKNPKTFVRITLAISRHVGFRKIMEDIITDELKEQ